MSLQFTIRKEVDFIALVPIVLGFHPRNSLVMSTLSGFHARIDLPAKDDERECIEALVKPALKHHVKQVALLTFDANHDAFQTLLVDSFQAAGIEVVAALDVVGDKYRQFGSSDSNEFDLASHPFTLEAHLNERAPSHMSREALEESIKPAGDGWVDGVQYVVELLRSDGLFKCFSTASRENSPVAVKLWAAAMRGCEPDSPLKSDIALMLSLNAWLSGDGALAWVALDHADKSEPFYRVMADVLDQAVSPHTWPNQ